MDDSWKAYLSSFLLTTALLGSLASAVDLEYITPDKSRALADQFTSAQLTDADQAAIVRKTAWTCDMYGMRTHLQVQHGLKLYEFKRDENGFHNHGAVPVGEYRVDHGVLFGKSERVSDRVRMTSKGELISQLTTNTTPGTVIAYSVCR